MNKRKGAGPLIKRVTLRLFGVIALSMVVHATALAQSEKIAPALQRTLAELGPDDEVAIIIEFLEKLDVDLFGNPDQADRRTALVDDLQTTADTSQASVATLLSSSGARDVRQLWIVNSLAATVPAVTVDELALRPEVERIKLDALIPLVNVATQQPPPLPWNHVAIGVPDLWALGFEGQGVVVATMDTGVDLAHPALASQWRGGSNSWFDPTGAYLSPSDIRGGNQFAGHGTQTMGLILADAINGEAIGMAPRAQWIAVKIFDDSANTTLSNVHLGFQWLLDPDGDPDTDDAPDIVNNSWGLQNTINICDPEFQPDIDALRAAGIVVVFAAGNTGPNPSTSISPANNPGAVSVGAIDEFHNIYQLSARGASACDGDEFFPDFVAPGVDVKTTDRSFGGLVTDPVLTTGTSASAPHVVGGMALLKSAFLGATSEDLEEAILATGWDLGEPGPDNDNGKGLIDLSAAYSYLSTNIPVEDKVKIVKTIYRHKHDKLGVIARSSAAPDAILTLPEYGDAQMEYRERRGFYTIIIDDVSTRPETVIVESSEGGADTKTVPFPDRVSIVRARYREDQQKLIVEARSDAQPDARLRLPEYGNIRMRFNPDKDVYRRVIRGVAEAPEMVTVTSSFRGRDTEAVPFTADRVIIRRARYNAKTQRLLVVATSNAAPGVQLVLPDYDLRMRYNEARRIYRRVIPNVSVNPGDVTVESSGSGFDTKPVPYPP